MSQPDTRPPVVTGRALINRIELASQVAMFKAAQRVLEDSNANIGVGDPRKDPDPAFALKEHGHIGLHPDGTVRIWYDPGGKAGSYATVQHERLDFKHPRGGGPKFLENALLKIIPVYERIIGDEVAISLKGLTPKEAAVLRPRDALGRFTAMPRIPIGDITMTG